MRLVFIGATGFGLRCLEEAARLPEVTVAGVITAPRTFSISYRPQGVTNVNHAELGDCARRLGASLVTMTGKMTDPELLDTIAGWRPELFLVVGWYHLVPRALRDLAPAIGLHASLLPDYSGGAPLVWAIIHGEPRTGISLFRLDDGVDSGDLLGQRAVAIHDDDTIATLYARVELAGLELVREHLPALARGTARFLPQDPARRRVFPQRSPDDGRIDWSWPARRVYDFVRAQTRPYPGAFTMSGDRRVIIWSARVVGDGEAAAGAVVACGGGGRLLITDAECDGRKLEPDELRRLLP